MTGDVLGTLRYMSPEQAAGRRGLVDHRSDVYSLGVTLYELLTLRPAFPQPNRSAVLRAVAESEPPRPRKLDRSVPRDLETVLLKATEKDPARRYQTAQAFADDLGRFLAGEPVLARRPTVADRGTKWVRRHRGLTASAAAILVVVTAASALSTAEISAAYENETRHRKDAETAVGREREQAEAARLAADRAAANYDLARQAVARMLTHVGAEHLSRVPEFAPVRTQVLKEAAAFCDELIAANPDDATGYEERARVRSLLGDYTGELADLRALVELRPDDPMTHDNLAFFYTQSLDVARRDTDLALAHARKAVSLDPRRARYRERLGRALVAAGRPNDAIRELEEAARLDPRGAAIFRSLVDARLLVGDAGAALSAAEESVRLDPDPHYGYVKLATALAALGRKEEALAALGEAELRDEKVLDARFAWTLELKGKLLADLGRHEEAVAAWHLATEAAPFRSYAFKWQAASKFRLGRFAEALDDLSRSLELNPRELSALIWVPPADAARCPDPAFREGLLRLADAAVARDGVACSKRGQLRAEFGDSAGARDDFKAGTERPGADHLAFYFHALACLAADDRPGYDAAARATFAKFAASDSPDAAGFALWTAALGGAASDDDGPAIELARRLTDARPADADPAKTLGATLYRAGRHAEAAEQLTVAEAAPGADPVHRAYARLFLAMALHELGRTDEARSWLARSFDPDPSLATSEARLAAGLPWHRRVTLNLLRKEAEELLAPTEAPGP